jgi:hypothetical protein
MSIMPWRSVGGSVQFVLCSSEAAATTSSVTLSLYVVVAIAISATKKNVVAPPTAVIVR